MLGNSFLAQVLFIGECLKNAASISGGFKKASRGLYRKDDEGSSRWGRVSGFEFRMRFARGLI